MDGEDRHVVHVGLDLSLTNAGIVVYRPSGLERAGGGKLGEILHKEIVGYGLKNTDPEMVRVARMLAIARKVISAIKDYGATTLNVEGPAFNAKSQHWQLGGLHYVVLSQVRLVTPLCKVSVVPPLKARQVVLLQALKDKGFKGTTKEWIAKRLSEIWSVDVGDEHQNDALVMVLWRALLDQGQVHAAVEKAKDGTKSRRRKKVLDDTGQKTLFSDEEEKSPCGA